MCEIRSLNSKSMDLSTRLSSILRGRELDIRTIVNQRLERGKVDLSMFIDEQLGTGVQLSVINWEAAKAYAEQYKAQFGEAPAEVMASILRFPDVIKQQEDNGDLTDEEWSAVQATLNQAIDAFIAFRVQEGAALKAMFNEKLDGIADLLAQVEPFEKGRVAKIKERLEQNLAKLSAPSSTP